MPASEQGVRRDRYQVIPRTLIFLTRGARVLLIKGAAHKRIWANRYNGVGGHVERGEDVLSAARRELLEETGLEAPDLQVCGVVLVDTGETPGIGVFVLSGECPTGEPVPSSEGTLEWLRIDELDGLPLVEDLHILLPQALAARANGAPFCALSRYDEAGRLVVSLGL